MLSKARVEQSATMIVGRNQETSLQRATRQSPEIFAWHEEISNGHLNRARPRQPPNCRAYEFCALPIYCRIPSTLLVNLYSNTDLG